MKKQQKQITIRHARYADDKRAKIGNMPRCKSFGMSRLVMLKCNFLTTRVSRKAFNTAAPIAANYQGHRERHKCTQDL